MTTKPQIGVFYALARSGGTIVSRCIASTPGLVLLSEVHPKSTFFSPIKQANDWYDLGVDLEEKTYFRDEDNYLEAIINIYQACHAKGLNLVIRDWPHADFTYDFRHQASPEFKLTQREILSQYFQLNECVLFRDPLDSYLSLNKLIDYKDRITIESYLSGVRKFLQRTKNISIIKYDDFCHQPNRVMPQICKHLGILFDKNCLVNFKNYYNLTGDIYHSSTSGRTLTGDPIGSRNSNEVISLPVHREGYLELKKAVSNNKDYQWIRNRTGRLGWLHRNLSFG